jgi:hypothetical protein
MTTARTRTRRRRVLAVLFLAAAAVATTSFFLADTGTTTLGIQPQTGLAAGGKLTAVSSMSSPFTRPQGNAQLQAGVALEQLVVTGGYENRVKLDVSWLDPQDAGQVMNNPNSQFYVGVYHPIHTGVCTSGQNNSVDDTAATITDTTMNDGSGGHVFCGQLDSTATGTIVNAGKMILSRTQLGGFLMLTASAPSSPPTCTGTGSTWCNPASGLSAGQLVAWLGFTIVTPGGKPVGQQNNVSQLDFYVASSVLS